MSTTSNAPAAAVITKPPKATRDQIRTGFFSSKAKSDLITLESGFEVEIRQPKVGAQLIIGQIEDPGQRMLRMFVDNIFVPGTTEKVFEDTDYELLKDQPAFGDYSKIMAKITALMGLDVAVKDAAKN